MMTSETATRSCRLCSATENLCATPGLPGFYDCRPCIFEWDKKRPRSHRPLTASYAWETSQR